MVALDLRAVHTVVLGQRAVHKVVPKLGCLDRIRSVLAYLEYTKDSVDSRAVAADHIAVVLSAVRMAVRFDPVVDMAVVALAERS